MENSTKNPVDEEKVEMCNIKGICWQQLNDGICTFTKLDGTPCQFIHIPTKQIEQILYKKLIPIPESNQRSIDLEPKSNSIHSDSKSQRNYEFYKNPQTCKFWLRGKCKRGNYCTFTHKTSERK